MKNGFTKSQNEIIDSVNKYLKEGNFRNAVVMTAHDTGFMDWYIEDTYLSYKTMVIITQ